MAAIRGASSDSKIAEGFSTLAMSARPSSNGLRKPINSRFWSGLISKRFDIEPTAGFDVPYLGCCRQHGMSRRQGPLQSVDNLGIDHPLALDPETDQLFTGLLLVAIVIARVRCDAVDKARAVESQSFEVLELPEPAEDLKQSGSERRAVDAAIRADGDQTQRVALLVLHDKKTPVRQLLYRRRLEDAGQGLEGRACSLVIWALCTRADQDVQTGKLCSEHAVGQERLFGTVGSWVAQQLPPLGEPRQARALILSPFDTRLLTALSSGSTRRPPESGQRNRMAQQTGDASRFDPEHCSAGELARAIGEGRLSAREACEAAIARIEARTGAINAVVVRDFERAREQAKSGRPRAGARRDGAALLGVPMTVKEAIDVAGLPTTWGIPHSGTTCQKRTRCSSQRAEGCGRRHPRQDQRARRSRGLAKLQPIYGRRTIRSIRRGAGRLLGRLGGRARGRHGGHRGRIRYRRVAARAAQFCGVFAHKPTFGLVPNRGHGFPGTDGGGVELAVAGPMTRFAADLDSSSA